MDAFFVFQCEWQCASVIENISKYQLGDSVCVDTNLDQFIIYRDNKVILESTVTRIAKQKVSWEKWLKKQ